jgi:diguanylate cyclase
MPSTRVQLPRRVYPLRILGMGLTGLMVSMVLWERQASTLAWAVLLAATVLWPHLAYRLSRRSKNPYRAETINLLMDSVIAGILVPLTYFNLLPSTLILMFIVVDRVTTGIRWLWLRSLAITLVSGAITTLVTGWHWAPETSMNVMLACLPLMVLHTLSVSVVAHKMIRKISRQNHLLNELQRIDPFTGLYTRRHWQLQAEQALRRHHSSNAPACLMMLDIDNFKSVNDRYGHTVGDEVIRALAHIVRNNVRMDDCAGRFGGDEFAIILPGMQAKDALAVAERIRAQTENVRLRNVPGLHITTSIGIAMADHRHRTLREWTHLADLALYRAKNAGRNRVTLHEEPELLPTI